MGFFYNSESNANFSDAMRYLYNSQNMSINQYCIAEYGNNEDMYYNCIYAQNIAPYIKTKIFSSQSQYDDWQIYCDLNNENATMINEYGENITSAYISNFTGSASGDHCGYLSSCRYHCGWHNVYNISTGQALFNFIMEIIHTIYILIMRHIHVPIIVVILVEFGTMRILYH